MSGKIVMTNIDVSDCGTVFDLNEGTDLSVTGLKATAIGTYLITRPKRESIEVDLIDLGLKPDTPSQIISDAIIILDKHKDEAIAKKIEMVEKGSLKEYLNTGTTIIQFVTALTKLFQ